MIVTVMHSKCGSCNKKPRGRSKLEKLYPFSQTLNLFYLQHIVCSMRCVHSGPVRSCAPLSINQKLDLILALHSSFPSARGGGGTGVGGGWSGNFSERWRGGIWSGKAVWKEGCLVSAGWIGQRGSSASLSSMYVQWH